MLLVYSAVVLAVIAANVVTILLAANISHLAGCVTTSAPCGVGSVGALTYRMTQSRLSSRDQGGICWWLS